MTRAARTVTVCLFAAACFAAAGDTARSPRLTRPWNQLDGLSDEQIQQIADLHTRAREEIRRIEQRERREIMAVLSQEQLNQLRDLEDKATVARKLKDAPSTQPAETP
jgi:Spy/CpxP family protein refolding chaperone